MKTVILYKIALTPSLTSSLSFFLLYAVQIGRHVYVLHVFQKKTRKGVKTPQKDMDVIKRRYQQAVEQKKESK